MSVIEVFLGAGAFLLLLLFLLYSVRVLAYARSDRPVIDERLRRYAKAPEG